MPNLTPQEQRLADLIQKGPGGLLERILELEDKVEAKNGEVDTKLKEHLDQVESRVPNVKDLLKQVKGSDGITPSDEKLIALIQPLIKDGEDGETPTEKQLLALIKPLIPKEVSDEKLLSLIKPLIPKPQLLPDTTTIAIEASKIAEERLLPFIPKIEDITNDLPKLGERIRDGLELLPEEEKLPIEAIKGLRKELDTLKKADKLNSELRAGGSITGEGARMLFKDVDLSAQFNGVLTTFQLQAVYNIISVSLSSYPYGSLRKNIDYSYTNTSITFLSTIDPTTQLSAGQQCVLTIVTS